MNSWLEQLSAMRLCSWNSVNDIRRDQAVSNQPYQIIFLCSVYRLHLHHLKKKKKKNFFLEYRDSNTDVPLGPESTALKEHGAMF